MSSSGWRRRSSPGSLRRSGDAQRGWGSGFHGGLDGSATERLYGGMSRRGAGLPIAAAAPSSFLTREAGLSSWPGQNCAAVRCFPTRGRHRLDRTFPNSSSIEMDPQPDATIRRRFRRRGEMDGDARGAPSRRGQACFGRARHSPSARARCPEAVVERDLLRAGTGRWRWSPASATQLGAFFRRIGARAASSQRKVFSSRFGGVTRPAQTGSMEADRSSRPPALRPSDRARCRTGRPPARCGRTARGRFPRWSNSPENSRPGM